MGVLKGLWSKLTGRNREQESDLYANYDKVDTVVNEINSIATTKVMNASDEVCAAMKAINNVNGMEKYVGTIKVSNFETAFDGISDTIKSIAIQLQEKAESIKRYEEAAWYEKAASTFAMGVTKLGEGILTPFEEIGDAAVGFVGWLAPKDSGLEKACTEFVKKDWSHDLFNFYYESEFADKSAITEDSVLANAPLVFGKTASLLALTPVMGPYAPLALSGLGSGTETGIKNGKDINSAFWQDGMIGAAAQLGLGALGGQAGILAGAAFNQYRNVKATQKAKEMEPALEIEAAVPGTDVFEPATTLVPPTGGGGGSQPVPPTGGGGGVQPVPPTSGGGGGQPVPPTSGGGGGNSNNTPETTLGKVQRKAEAKAELNKIEKPTERPLEIPTAPATNQNVPPTNNTPPTEHPTEFSTHLMPGTKPSTNTSSGGQDNSTGVGTNNFAGGEYGENGFTPDDTKDLASLDESLLDGTTSISDILGGKSITKVKSNTPISGKSKISGSSSKVIPLAAGLTAAAAAGIGAKAYLDSRDREDEEDEYDDDDEFEEVDWSDENSLGSQSYEQQEMNNIDTSGEFSLDDNDNFYIEDNDYNAANNEELVELQ